MGVSIKLKRCLDEMLNDERCRKNHGKNSLHLLDYSFCLEKKIKSSKIICYGRVAKWSRVQF